MRTEWLEQEDCERIIAEDEIEQAVVYAALFGREPHITRETDTRRMTFSRRGERPQFDDQGRLLAHYEVTRLPFQAGLVLADSQVYTAYLSLARTQAGSVGVLWELPAQPGVRDAQSNTVGCWPVTDELCSVDEGQ